MVQRRRNLRRQRGQRLLKTFWRLVVVGAFAGGLIWLMGQPIWLVRSAEQIQIKGNQAIQAESLRAMVPVDYPQSLLKIKPQVLEKALLDQAPLAEAKISRRLIPPGLVIRVSERQPVAVAELARSEMARQASATSDATTAANQKSLDSDRPAPDRPATSSPNEPKSSPSAHSTPPTSKTKSAPFEPTPGAERVLLDATGEWVSLAQYDNPEALFELPSLKVYGMRPEYSQHWPELYGAILQSPVKVLAIDWRDPSNLELKTDLGNVHFGPYGPQFSYQLEILDRMRNLPNHTEADQIAFIDLKTPTVPRLQMKATLKKSDSSDSTVE